MGLRLTEFAPVVTKTDASAGLKGSSVVPSRPNWRAAAVANAPDADAVAIAATVREADGPRAPVDRADWTKAPTTAKSGGGGRITFVTCHCVSRTSTAHPLPQPGFVLERACVTRDSWRGQWG